MTIADKLKKIADNVQKVFSRGYAVGSAEGKKVGYTDGQTAEYDRFWDSFQNKGKKYIYTYAFAGMGWTDESYNPKYDINATGTGTYLFNANQNITSTKVPIIITTSGSNNVFATCTKLKEIPSLKVTSSVTFTTWFHLCGELETINFTSDSEIANNIDFSACVKLSTASLQNIISVLSKDKSATLTLPSKFNTDEYKDIIDSKPSGWTISWK